MGAEATRILLDAEALRISLRIAEKRTRQENSSILFLNETLTDL
jgi:hypothetical protein